MTIQLVRGNALDLPLADNTVDLIVTSPPYFGLRSYQDGGEHYDGQIGDEATPEEFVDALIAATREMARVLKPSGNIFVNLGDSYAGSGTAFRGEASTSGNAISAKAPDGSNANQGRLGTIPGIPARSLVGIPWRYAIRCIDELGLLLRAEIIWDKPNGLPEPKRSRVRRSHEQWFHLTLRHDHYDAVDMLREPHKGYAGFRGHQKTYGKGQRNDDGRNGIANSDPALGRVPGSVWNIATEGLVVPEELGVDHFAAYPMEWPRRFVRGWAPTRGICSACGHGLRPVTSDPEKRGGRERRTDDTPAMGAGVAATGYMAAGAVSGYTSSRSIIGWACECNEPIATPTGRDAEPDPSLFTGRAGMNRPRSADEGVRYISRHQQRHEARELRDSPHRAEMEAEAGTAFAHYIRTDVTGGRPIPEALREKWHAAGWLTPAPAYHPAPTTRAVVLDPFGGTGTTVMVADAEGCDGIHVDMSRDYLRLAEWRTNDPRQRARAAEREFIKPREQVAGQLGLFGELGELDA